MGVRPASVDAGTGVRLGGVFGGIAVFGTSTYSRTLRVITIMALLLTSVGLTATPARAATCARTVLSVVAHQDDDLLFMNPDLENELRNGSCAVTVFVTAGDIGAGTSYWVERELGPQSAYNTMLGLAENTSWSANQRTFAGHSVHTVTSGGAGNVTLIYLRLPDGGLQGNGFPSTGNESLAKLADGRISTIDAIDGSATYTRSGLVEMLAAIVAATAPTAVHTQDARAGQADHIDHIVTAQFSQEALIGFTGTVEAYRGYTIANEPANVTGAELTRKTAALVAYSNHDPYLCGSPSDCPSGVEAEWNERQYNAPLAIPTNPVPGPAPYSGPNLARNASVLASTQESGQEATKAIDSVIAGWPANGTAEWSSSGQRNGAWIQLYWSAAQTIDRVYLYDRPNLNDQVTGGTLTFSDGTTVNVPELNNNGTATIVTFTARATTTLRFTVTSTSGSTSNIGLAEIETYNGDPTATPAAGTSTTTTSVERAEPSATPSSSARPSPSATTTDPEPSSTPPRATATTSAQSTPSASSSATPTASAQVQGGDNG